MAILAQIFARQQGLRVSALMPRTPYIDIFFGRAVRLIEIFFNNKLLRGSIARHRVGAEIPHAAAAMQGRAKAADQQYFFEIHMHISAAAKSINIAEMRRNIKFNTLFLIRFLIEPVCDFKAKLPNS